MRILVACDLTARSDRAIARGAQLAEQLGASLHLLHVVDGGLKTPYRDHSVDWAKTALADQAGALAKSGGIDAKAEVRVGDPRVELVKTAEQLGTDLIVVGVHGDRASGAKAFAETTAGKLLKSTLHSVLLVRDDAGEPYRNAVIGIDFSLHTRAALTEALTVAPEARFQLVHAYHLPFVGLAGGRGFSDQVAYEERLKLDAFLAEEMQAVGERAQRLGMLPDSTRTVMVEGEPAQALRAACAETPADLVVIGTHGRAGLSRAIWGSVAADLLNEPPCDVLVFKPYAGAEAA